MWEGSLISASRYDPRFSQPLATQSASEYKLFSECWASMALVDLYGFPLWEKGVHDALQPHFGELQSIFRAYSCGTIAAGARSSFAR